jgi:hypothetical protein
MFHGRRIGTLARVSTTSYLGPKGEALSAKLEGAALSIFGGIAAGITTLALTGAGCATGVNPADIGAGDGEAQDHTAERNPVGATADTRGGNDAANGIATSDTGSSTDAPDTSTNSDAGSGSVAMDGTAAYDATTAMDADGGRTDGDAGRRRDADASANSDGDAATTCDTAAILLADAGVSGAMLLFAFDDGVGAASWIGRWDQDPTDAAAAPVVIGVTDAGHTCPGALQATFAFTTYAQQAEVQYNYRPPLPYAAGVNVHMWVKLIVVGDTDGGGYQNFSDLMAPVPMWTAGDASAWVGDFTGNHYPPSFANGYWQEAIAPVGSTDAGSITMNLQQLSANLQSQWTDAGPLPSTAILLIDDIWIE